jgi:hypothetical protein
MSSKVCRSFSPFRESDESEDDYRYSFSLASRRSGRLSWGDLLKKRLAVILGEAGIGKTFEFQHSDHCRERQRGTAVGIWHRLRGD